MSIRRLAAVGATVAILFATLAAPATAADNKTAAGKAAAYIAAQVGTADHLTSDFGDEGITADALLALQSVHDTAYDATIAKLATYLRAQAPAYAAKSPEGAAKLVLVAVALGDKPTSFAGVDLVAAVQAGVKADGSFGAYPGPFAQGLGIIALKRAGVTPSDALYTWLISQADPATKGWGYEKGQPADADNTGMAVMALATSTSADAKAARDAALAWAGQNQAADGSWAGYAPVNSTSIMGMAQLASGADNAKAVTWVASQLGSDGGAQNGGKSDLMATVQAVPLLAGVTYLDLPGSSFPWTIVAIAAAAVVVVAVAAVFLVRRRRAGSPDAA